MVTNELHISNLPLPVGEYPQQLEQIFSLDRARFAQRTLGHFPQFATTSMLTLDRIPAHCQVASIHYKDESNRLGLSSFKALGAPYAIVRVATEHLMEITGERDIDLHCLIAGKYASQLAELCVASATDGNHGLALAWAAEQLGCRCRIYLHENASAKLDQLFQQQEAEVIWVAGNYDDSVHRCRDDAEQLGHTVISDTSYEGYLKIPRQVMEGYAVLCLEAFEQLDQAPTHIFIQAGVGSLAAAVMAAFWAHYQPTCPSGIIVEPESAACMYDSAIRRERTRINGEHQTIMDGLACGEPSVLAWQIVSQIATAYIKISDQAAAEAIKSLARQSISAGPSGAAGLAGLIQVAGDDSSRKAIGLDETSRVLLIGTEAARTVD